MATTSVAYGGNPETTEYDITIVAVDSAVTELSTSYTMWLSVNHYETSGGSRSIGNRIANTAELTKCLDVLRAVLMRMDFPRSPSGANYSGVTISKEAGPHPKDATANDIGYYDDSTYAVVTTGIQVQSTPAVQLIFSETTGAYRTRQELLDFLSKVENTILRTNFPYA
jgi:hypothetical protein